jgi:AcrR family transcriptional regulator
MADKGMEGVAINEITEAADVGFGSFYNHFESKEAIYDAVTDWVFESFGDALDRLVKDVKDPAEVIAICVRHTLLRGRREPVWGRFLVREGFSARALTRGLGQRLVRDIMLGLAAKRFVTNDPMMTFISVGGINVAAMSAQLQFSSGNDSANLNVARALGYNGDHLPERTAAAVLRALGLKASEADTIARRPLPVSS